MEDRWLVAVSPMIGLLVDALAQALGSRLVGVGRSIVLGMIAGFLSTAFLTILASPAQQSPLQRIGDCAVELLTFVLLAFNYWTFLNLNVTSIRLRVVKELALEQTGLSLSSLRDRYSSSEFLGRRLERLEGMRQMFRSEGRWHLRSPVLVTLLLVIETLRSIAIPRRGRPNR